MKRFIIGAAAVAALLTALPASAEVVVRTGGIAVHRDHDWHRHHADCRVVKVRTRLPNGNVVVRTRRSC